MLEETLPQLQLTDPVFPEKFAVSVTAVFTVGLVLLADRVTVNWEAACTFKVTEAGEEVFPAPSLAVTVTVWLPVVVGV